VTDTVEIELVNLRNDDPDWGNDLMGWGWHIASDNAAYCGQALDISRSMQNDIGPDEPGDRGFVHGGVRVDVCRKCVAAWVAERASVTVQ